MRNLYISLFAFNHNIGRIFTHHFFCSEIKDLALDESLFSTISTEKWHRGERFF